MKNIKLKCLTLSLFVMTFASCMKPDIIESANKEAKETIDSFVFEDGIREYVIDGKTVTDHQQIANAAKDAWNVHYDFPNEKVVISTTPKMFDSYQNSNTEFKQALEQNAKSAAIATDNNNEDTRSAKVAATPPSYISGYANQSMIMFRRVQPANPPNESIVSNVFFIASRDATLDAVSVTINAVYQNSGTVIFEGASNTRYNFSNITKTSVAGTTSFRCYLNNESATEKLMKTFYTGKNYTGNNKSFTAKPNSNVDISGLRGSSGYLSFN